MPQPGQRLVASLVGRRFGRLEVLEDLGAVHREHRIYLCRCDCGRLLRRRSYRLRHHQGRESCPLCARRSSYELSAADRDLAADHFAWAIAVAWRWKRDWRRFEDEIDSAVSEALVVAARDYDATKIGGNFEFWCYRRMVKEVTRTISRMKKHEEFRAALLAMAERLI